MCRSFPVFGADGTRSVPATLGCSHLPFASNRTLRNGTMDSRPTDQTSSRVSHDNAQSAPASDWYCRSVATEHVRQLCFLFGAAQACCCLVLAFKHPGYLLPLAVSSWFALRSAGLFGRSKAAVALTIGMAAGLLVLGKVLALDLAFEATSTASFVLYADVVMLSLLAFADIYDRRY